MKGLVADFFFCYPKMTKSSDPAPLPGYTDPVVRNAAIPDERPMPQLQPQPQVVLTAPKTEPYVDYAEGNTEYYDNALANYEMFYDIPQGGKKDNNTMIIALSVASAGLLLIIITMLFFTRPRRR